MTRLVLMMAAAIVSVPPLQPRSRNSRVMRPG